MPELCNNVQNLCNFCAIFVQKMCNKVQFCAMDASVKLIIK